jgi:hypothetical protein
MEDYNGKKRIAVKQFADAMEIRLQEKDQEKGEEGWLDCDNDFLIACINEKLEDLEYMLSHNVKGNAQSDCVDIANFAMMLFDKLCRR